MNGNSPIDLPRTPSTYSMNMDEQTKVALEENVGLKSYIDVMNSECLELNAALFEEANKMVTAARSKQVIAERRAKEKTLENEALRSQVEELRALISNLPSPLSPSRGPINGTLPSVNKHNRKSGHNQRDKQRKYDTPVYRMSCDDLRLLAPKSSDATALTTVSRSTLLNALLANVDESDELDSTDFKLFIDWTKMNHPLCLPVSIDTPRENKMVSQNLVRERRVLIVRDIPESRSRTKTPEPEGSDADEALPAFLHYSSEISSTRPSMTLDIPQQSKCSEFIQLIFYTDIRPCLKFSDRKITMAIYQALPTMSLEMVPIDRHNRKLSTVATSPLADPTNPPVKTCPLLPPLVVHYRLTVKAPSPTRNSADSQDDEQSDSLVVDISTSARHRIAAVVSLFQYLSLISRGIATSPSPRAVSLTTLNGPGSDRRVQTLPSRLPLVDLSKQFRKIQRLRLTIAFSRLGFGLPECD